MEPTQSAPMPPVPPRFTPPQQPQTPSHSSSAFWYVLGGLLALFVIIGAFYYLTAASPASAPAQAPTTIIGTDSPQPSSQLGDYQPTNNNAGGPGSESCYFSKDGQVYWSTDSTTYTPVAGADAGTFYDFSIEGLCLGKDTKHVYNEGEILSGMDPASFDFLEEWRNGDSFFQNGSGIVDFKSTFDSSTKTFTTYMGTPIPVQNSDAATYEGFEGLSGFTWFGKDKNNVYCNGAPIPGADPATAQQVESYAGDWLKVTVDGKALIYNTDCETVDPSVPAASGASYSRA